MGSTPTHIKRYTEKINVFYKMYSLFRCTVLTCDKLRWGKYEH